MTGELKINGQDAYTTWGISLQDGGLSALMTPAPCKAYVSNKSRLEHGARYVSENNNVSLARLDERQITLPFNMTAKTKTQFLQRYASFCEVLKAGKLDIWTKYQPTVVYHTLYTSCTQYGQYQQEMGKFSLKLTEPNPSNRAL